MNLEQKKKLAIAVDQYISENGYDSRTRPVGNCVKQVKWEELDVDFGGGVTFEPEQMKDVYDGIVKGVRGYRTYKEMREDILTESTKISKDKRIKRPASAFALFFNSRCPIYKEKYPELTIRDFMTKAGEDWKQLSQKKRAKYDKIYAQNKEEYDKKMNKEKKKAKGPAPPKTPVQLYAEKHGLSEDGVVDEGVEKKFRGLKDSKKLSYVKQAVNELKDYRVAVKEFRKMSPDFIDKVKLKNKAYPLTIPEFNLWKIQHLSAPAELQASAKDQFAAEQNLNPMEAKDMWASLTKSEKKEHNTRHRKIQAEYNSTYNSWFKSLDSWIQEELEFNGQGIKLVKKVAKVVKEEATTTTSDDDDSDDDDEEIISTPSSPVKSSVKIKTSASPQKLKIDTSSDESSSDDSSDDEPPPKKRILKSK